MPFDENIPADGTTPWGGPLRSAWNALKTFVNGLETAISGKASTSHQHAAADVTSGTLNIARIPTGTTGTTVALGNHTHTAASVGAAAASHTHTAADVGAAPASHTHTAAEVGAAPVNHTHTPASLGAAAAAHQHAVADVTGLQAALDGKVDEAHVAGLDGVGWGRAVFIPNGGTIPEGTPPYTIVIEASA